MSHKFAIIGFGSIGQKHFKALTEEGHSVAVISRRDQSKFSQHYFSDITSCLNEFSPEVIVICSETSKHLEDLNQLSASNFKGKILVEKPLLKDHPNEEHTLSKNIFINYQLRFHPLLQQLKEDLKHEKIISAHFYVGQNLTQWREGRDLSSSYSSSIKLGGGVLRDLSHELDLCSYLLGDMTSLVSHGGKDSNLDIQSMDQYSVLGSNLNCPNITIHMNYLAHIPQRYIRILTNDDTYLLDYISGTLRSLKTSKENQQDANSLFKKVYDDLLSEKPKVLCNYDEAVNILKLIQKIETSNREKKWVSL